jgi:uncharacterized protein
MKKILFFVIAVFAFYNSASAQIDPNVAFLNTRKIEVSGSAEMEIVPDEIYYTISLQEYKGDKKVEIETLEKQLVKSVAEAGIAKENLQIENMQGYKWNTERKKNQDFFASKQYVLKLNNLYKINEILSGVDSKGVQYTTISRYSHSKIEQYRKDIKIKALQAAKEKASYLLASINEQVGEVLQIQEVGDYYPQPYETRMMSNMAMDKSAEMASPEIGFKEIKLRYEVRGIFKIK